MEKMKKWKNEKKKTEGCSSLLSAIVGVTYQIADEARIEEVRRGTEAGTVAEHRKGNDVGSTATRERGQKSFVGKRMNTFLQEREYSSSYNDPIAPSVSHNSKADDNNLRKPEPSRRL